LKNLLVVFTASFLISTVFVVVDLVRKEQEIRKGAANQVEDDNNEHYFGYIIELRELPLTKKFSQSKDKLTQSRLKELENHIQVIEKEHGFFKERSVDVLKKPVEQSILGEYSKVFNGIALDITDEEAEELKNLPCVKAVYPNYEVHTTLRESVPLISATSVWQDHGVTGEGMTIAIIDTGIDYTHPDLGGCIGPECKVLGGYDFSDNDDDPIDYLGHGTHCAGLAAGKGDYNQNNIYEPELGEIWGVAPNAKLYAYKVFPEAWDSVVISAIERSIDPNQDDNFSDHVDVISMSLGGSGNPDDPLCQSVDNAFNVGVVVTISAGNNGPRSRTIGSPGVARNAITVGATYKKAYGPPFWMDCEPSMFTDCGRCPPEGKILCDYWSDGSPKTDQIVAFSSRGPVVWDGKRIIKPDVVAPGALICSARFDEVFPVGQHPYYYPCLDNEHLQLAGTSMSTPLVAGAAALLINAHSDWNPEEIKTALKNTAADIGYDIFTQGAGKIDVNKAVRLPSAPPIAKINIAGRASGQKVDIVGTATGSNFLSYVLYYSEGENVSDDDWNRICRSTKKVNQNLLCTFRIASLEDGLYSLKLVVKTQGQQSVAHSFMEVKNTMIIAPSKNTIIPTWKNALIRGTSHGSDFDHYTLEWCLKGVCSNQGIELTSDGLLPVAENVLGNWDTSILTESDFYTIKLTTHYVSKTRIHESRIYVDTTLQAGWPIDGEPLDFGYTPHLGFWDQPMIADIDNDGKNDLITAYYRVIGVLNHQGNFVEGWPIEIKTEFCYGNQAIVHRGPAIADLDGDGFNEIAIGDSCDYLHIFNHDGTYMTGWPKHLLCHVSPIIADINNDGQLDIVCDADVFDVSGNHLEGWPSEGPNLFGITGSSTAVADLDNDGFNEIVIKGSTFLGEKNWQEQLWVLNHDATNLEGWPKELGITRHPISSPVLGDIDNDSNIEIVIVLYDGKIYAFEADGSYVEGWPIHLGDTIFSAMNSLSLADIDNDGFLEIAVTAKKEDGIRCLFALEHTGEIVENFPVCYGSGTSGYIRTNLAGIPVIADLDSDDELEIVVGDLGGSLYDLWWLYAFNHDATIVNGFPKRLRGSPWNNIIPVGDLDNDGDNELIVRDGNNLIAWDLGGDADKIGWPMPNQNAKRTGLHPFVRSCGDICVTRKGYQKAACSDVAYNVGDCAVGTLCISELEEVFSTDCSTEHCYCYNYVGCGNSYDTCQQWCQSDGTCQETPLTQGPDLIITDIWNEEYRIKYKIKNIGDSNSGRVYSVLSVDGLEVELVDSASSMAPGVERTESFGNYQWLCSDNSDAIKVCADAGGLINETNEDNNCKTIVRSCRAFLLNSEPNRQSQ